jgi:hypothetical protein
MSNLITASRLKVSRACLRDHHIKYELGFRPVEDAAALRFGTLFHSGLEAWWKNHTNPNRLELALAAMTGESDPFDRAKAEVLLRGYEARWGQEPYEVLAVEQEFETELRNPETGAASRTWRLAGKIDAVVRCLNTNRVLLVEHKTSSENISVGSEYWRRLRMDGQVSIYYAGARSLGFDVEGCTYDVISKPGLKPLKATPMESRKYTAKGLLYANQRAEDETPEEYRARLIEDVAADPAGYFARGEVTRLESEMEEAMFDVWQQAQQIREAQLANRWPRNPDACMRYGRTCPYFSICSGEESLEGNPKFVRSVAHPELTGGQGPKEEAACQSQP